MSTASLNPMNGSLRSNPWMLWLPIALGLAALYIPTYISLWNGVWNTEEQGHGPLIPAVVFLLASIVCLRREQGPGLLHRFCGTWAFATGEPRFAAARSLQIRPSA